tara:strand:+ start:447 stop:629 length:183 start_codon:yes stop_codon:yes gene_type:complete
MFYIAFDGFDLFGLHFETREAAEKHLEENYMKLARHCQYQVAVYERDKKVIPIGQKSQPN